MFRFLLNKLTNPCNPRPNKLSRFILKLNDLSMHIIHATLHLDNFFVCWLPETWWDHCSSGWGLVCVLAYDLNYMSFVNLFDGYLSSLCSFYAACCQDQHMKLLLRSCTRHLKIISASASQNYHVLTSPFLIMLVMWVPPLMMHSISIDMQKKLKLKLVILIQVTYQTELFLDKNKDYVVAEHQALLSASKCSFVSSLFPLLSEDASKSSKFSSIGSRFKV